MTLLLLQFSSLSLPPSTRNGKHTSPHSRLKARGPWTFHEPHSSWILTGRHQFGYWA